MRVLACCGMAILLSILKISAQESPGILITGRVVNERSGQPVEKVIVTLKQSPGKVMTDGNGYFAINLNKSNDTLAINHISFEPKLIAVSNQTSTPITILITEQTNNMDEVVVIGYGITTRRFNTGSVSKVTANIISKQPVSNPIAALEGRAPGVMITQSNGLPGSNFSVQIRGKGSLLQGTQPLYIIDGVPFMLNSGVSLAQVSSLQNQSPFNSLNPLDIESIEILKDADATAIYGSQGANGVVLITTKKGKVEKTQLSVNYYYGIGKAPNGRKLMNTKEYLTMRNQAFALDGQAPSINNAPDLLLWDTTRYTNWRDKLIGGTANTQDLQATLSGGNYFTQFFLSGNYHREVTVFPGATPATRGSVRLNLNHSSVNNKFKLAFSSAYSIDSKNQYLNDLTAYTYLPPNAPEAYDSTGKLTWNQWVRGVDNPMSYLERPYESQTGSLVANANMHYQLLPGVSVSLNAGFNNMQLNEKGMTTIISQRPSANTTGSLFLSSANLTGWILEPQLHYSQKIWEGTLEALAGLSFQQRIQRGNTTNGNLYTNDDLLGTLSAAGRITATNSFTQYNYTAAFARLLYNLKNRYIVNLNARRDGGSRFGPANRFADFGAAGAAWIFSSENWIKQHLTWLSYGKVRVSYGITGNDQIADYQYIDSWTSSSVYQYGDVAGILPSSLYNASLAWEKNRKAEAAIELGFLQDRIFISAAYFKNRSSNQLVAYRLPNQTGFASIYRNLDAVIQNTGLELELSTTNIRSAHFSWKTTANLTMPRNKLIQYPNLANSADKSVYVVGQPLSLFWGYRYLNIDPDKGVYTFEDQNKDGIISFADDRINLGSVMPTLYGGMSNSFSYKNWQLDIFLQGTKQQGRNYIYSFPNTPGNIGNQPVQVKNSWASPNDQSEYQRYTATAGTAAYQAYFNYRNSSAVLTDASYIRVKNVYLSYAFNDEKLKRWKVSGLRLYLQAQNLFTITGYDGVDPETQNMLTLPPLKVITAGIQLTL